MDDQIGNVQELSDMSISSDEMSNERKAMWNLNRIMLKLKLISTGEYTSMMFQVQQNSVARSQHLQFDGIGGLSDKIDQS
jgi:hypothetical protein